MTEDTKSSTTLLNTIAIKLLPKPIPITEQNWPDGTVPLVSICCITYNHEKFIRECFDGFLMQETTFPVEILIHDDASTDKTDDILREYESKYPNLMKPIYQVKNQYSQGIKPFGTYLLPSARGKYIAFCEGDDYWTDPMKLEMQVYFLESNPDYVLTCHNTWRIWDDGSQPECAAILHEKDELDLVDFIDLDYFQRVNNLVLPAHTSSYVARQSAILNPLPDLYFNSLSGDMCIFALIAAEGNVKYFRKFMSVRRKHDGSITKRNDVERIEAYIRFVATIKAIDKHFEGRFKDIQARKVEEHLDRIVAYFVNQGAFFKALSYTQLAMNFSSTTRLIFRVLIYEICHAVKTVHVVWKKLQ